MKKLKEILGLDLFDIALQAVITGVIIFWITESNTHQDAVILGSAAATISLVVLGVRRRLALYKVERSARQVDVVASERLAELEERVADLEAAQARMAELEERVDFAERLLARGAERPKELA